MPTMILTYNDREIREMLAEKHGVSIDDVQVTISAPYDGGPLDRSPGSATFTVRAEGKDRGR